MTTTTTLPATASPLLSGLNRALELVEAQIAQVEATEPIPKGGIRGAPNGGESYRLDDLELFAQRLRQIQQWLQQDPALLTVVDAHITQQARQVERRLARQNIGLAVLTTFVGALLGWLLSLASTPLQLLHALGH